MAENPQLDERVVHDLNADPELPFDDGVFDAVVVTVSIQYMVRPVGGLQPGKPGAKAGRRIPRHILQPHVPHEGGGHLAGAGRYR